MNKLIATIIIGIFLISFVSANLGTFKIDNTVPIRVLANCSSIKLIEVTNSEHSFLINSTMDLLAGQTWNYNFVNNSYNGGWTYSWENPCENCADGSCGNSFKTTPTGTEFDNSQAIIFFGLLLLFVLFLSAGVYGLSYALSGAWQIAYICLAYLSLFCIFFVCWLYASNYLWATPIIASIFWIFWLILAFGFFPFILVVGTYIVGKGMKDNLFKKYKAEGYSDEEAHDMAKQKRR